MNKSEKHPAIVLAAFGTTDIDALQSIDAIKTRISAAFPRYDIHLAFTSNIVRKVWRNRGESDDFRNRHPSIPEELYRIPNVLSALAAIQEDAFRPVLVQSLHVTDGEEYQDLASLVEALRTFRAHKPQCRPFPVLELGEPALGIGDGPPASLERAADALAPLAERAKAAGQALILMGHGNEHLNQTVFAKLEVHLRERFGRNIFIGTVEARPFPDDIIAALALDAAHPDAVLLAPLMVVAGDHARNDMAGDEDGSWKSIFAGAGYSVETHLEGLGSNPSWADIYVEHLAELEQRLQHNLPRLRR